MNLCEIKNKFVILLFSFINTKRGRDRIVNSIRLKYMIYFEDYN